MNLQKFANFIQNAQASTNPDVSGLATQLSPQVDNSGIEKVEEGVDKDIQVTGEPAQSDPIDKFMSLPMPELEEKSDHLADSSSAKQAMQKEAINISKALEVASGKSDKGFNLLHTLVSKLKKEKELEALYSSSRAPTDEASFSKLLGTYLKKYDKKFPVNSKALIPETNQLSNTISIPEEVNLGQTLSKVEPPPIPVQDQAPRINSLFDKLKEKFQNTYSKGKEIVKANPVESAVGGIGTAAVASNLAQPDVNTFAAPRSDLLSQISSSLKNIDIPTFVKQNPGQTAAMAGIPLLGALGYKLYSNKQKEKNKFKMASVYLEDKLIKTFPKDVQDEILKFSSGSKERKVISYMMTYPELLPQVDKHNYAMATEKAKKRFHGVDKEKSKEELKDRCKNKYIILLNDKIIDGHHHLAQIEYLDLTCSIPVVDITPLRFQKNA